MRSPLCRLGGATRPITTSHSPMKKLAGAVAAGMLVVSSGCQEFLDVNTNPNGPETVAANLYLPPMIHWMVTSPQFDGRFIARYTQEWHRSDGASVNWGNMGYDPSSDNGGEQWRNVYTDLGQNLSDMMRKAEEEQRWDVLGVGKVLRAWGWQVLADTHGEIILTDALDPTKFTFKYDSQEAAYAEVQKLLNEAITLLQRTDGLVDPGYLARGDRMYNGDRTKWLKLAYGMLALNLNHYTNKATYKPADVITNVNRSFASNADDPLLTYPNTQNNDINFLGRTRGNMTTFRQTRFVLGLMDGTVFTGAVDPRMSRMLSPSPDGQYRGLDPNVQGFGGLAAAQQPNNLHGFPGTGGNGAPGRYIFDDKAKLPVMTFAQLQFIKAEAAYKLGDFGTALQAYTAGISAHIDFVNARNADNGQPVAQISAAEKAAFLANPAIVPATPAGLTLTRIMSQKYIAQWGWGHNEIWMDMRRYNYTDVDPASGQQVYPGFALPLGLFVDNAGKPVQRMRPRFNSEYVWNRKSLEEIGGLAADYQTKPLWITQR
ncbi:MAG TPA: RagB/SusD family nutrient uptake outer membrane protein [Gemmatimonas sp.]|nr:RagB/SusD family nutrient uptake outer membrane protein [Gemmatimonas sp.]